MSGNPYALRASLLAQAEGILQTRFHTETDRIRFMIDRKMVEPKMAKWPSPPTSEQIINEAEKLYSFVKKKS